MSSTSTAAAAAASSAAAGQDQVAVRAFAIRNKAKRHEVHAARKAEKSAARKERREKRKRERDELGEAAPAPQAPKTLDSMRMPDDTFVSPEDEEVARDEASDEFAPYFDGSSVPKIMITTRPRPSKSIFPLISELMSVIPNSFFYKRGEYHLKEICGYAAKHGFTHLMVLNEARKAANMLIVVHLPAGPTACFKLTSTKLGYEIKGSGAATDHQPELILNNFRTRLGHRVGRMLGSLFPHQPDFVGRNVVTFHNHRDFIFVRRHRYIFDDNGKRARLQELGPRFTLKMRWLLADTFNTSQGEYEWYFKRHRMEDSKKRFFL